MAGKGNGLQESILRYLFTTATAAATSTTTTLWVALHTADPGNSGNQATNEVSYTNYARQVTQRTTGTGGWIVSGTSPCSVFPSSAITFAQCTTSSTVVITNWSVGTSSSVGTTTGLYYCGTVTPNISLNANVTPSLTTASACTED